MAELPSDPKAAMAYAIAAFDNYRIAIRERQYSLGDGNTLDRIRREQETKKTWEVATRHMGTIFEEIFGIHPMDGKGQISF